MSAKSNPIVSIITPTYNHSQYIEECILSVRNQSYQNWQMIIIDDGSTDDTYNKCLQYAAIDSRIKVYTQQNVGIFKLQQTYNKALEYSSGDFIAILEGDDYWEQDKLEVQVRHMLAKPAAVLCWSKAASVKGSTKEILSVNPIFHEEDIPKFNNDPTGNIFNILQFRNCIPALTIMMQREALFAIGGFQQGYHLPLVDFPTILALSVKGPFIFIDKVLGSWRHYPNQVTKTYTVEIYKGFYDLKLDFINQNAAQLANVYTPDFNQLKRLHRADMIIAHSRIGRYSLLRKQYKLGRSHYWQSLKIGITQLPMWKIRSIIGLVCSYLHIDVEFLAKYFGAGSLK